MNFMIIFTSILVGLFLVAFMTKRRFGLLGLALATGAYLSTLLVGDVTPLIARAGVVLTQPPLETVVAAGLILLPAVLLLLSGPTYRMPLQRIIGALLFTVLAGVLLLQPLGFAVVIDGAGKPVYDFIVHYRVTIITLCLIAAVFDVMATKIPKAVSKH
jgi:hypothetical protein